jgi:hypothetical protein
MFETREWYHRDPPPDAGRRRRGARGSYEERNGFRVPTEGNVGWYVDGEWHGVWKGTILDFEVQTPK